MAGAILLKPNDAAGGVRSPLPVPQDKQFTIGRAHTASLDLPRFEVSRLHCVIEYKANQWTICDKSSFGTTLNGVRLEKNEVTELKDGDKIVISVLKNSYVFCTNGENCANKCKDIPMEEVISAEDDRCQILQQSIRKSKNGMEELKSLQSEINKQFNLQLHGIHEKFQEQARTQTPDQIKLLKGKMEKEKTEIIEKYTKEVSDLGKRLGESQAEQENLKHQIDLLFEERGRDWENLRELSDDLDEMKREKEKMGEANAVLEQRVKEISETMEAEKENVKKQCLDNIGDIMESELQCCICNELFVKATSINCSHTFCENCINSWLRNNNVCPMCRAVVTARTRSLVIDTYIDKMVQTLSEDIKERRKTLLKEREEAAKTAPPPPPLAQPPLDVIAVRTANGAIQFIQNPVRVPGVPGSVRVINSIGSNVQIRPNVPGIRPLEPAPAASVAPVIVRAQVMQPAAGAQHGRNVRPRLPHNPGTAVIDLTGLSPIARLNNSHHRRHRR